MKVHCCSPGTLWDHLREGEHTKSLAPSLSAAQGQESDQGPKRIGGGEGRGVKKANFGSLGSGMVLSPLQDPGHQYPVHRVREGAGVRRPRGPQYPNVQGNDQRWRTMLFAHVFWARFSLLISPFLPNPLLLNTRATLPGGHRAWVPKPRLWEQSDLISNEDSANCCPCDAGQFP